MKKWLASWRGSARKTAPSDPVDLTSAAFFCDPAPIYAALRADQPIAPVRGGGYVIMRHADVLAALSDAKLGNAPSRFSALGPRNAAKYPAAALAANIAPFLDKPDHIPARQAVMTAYREVFAGAQGWLPDLARDHVARHTGVVDLVADVARPFACDVMARFLVVAMDVGDVKVATAAFFHLFAPITDADVFAQVNTDIDAALEKTGLTPAQVVDNAYLILADGVENIEAGVASAIEVLIGRGMRTVNDGDVAECLRLNSPAQILPRVAREDMVLHDTDIAAGVPVFLALGSANLDPDAFIDPTVFDASRAQAPVLVFGRGRHACIGAGLAQLQIKSLQSALLGAGVTLHGDAPTQYAARFGHRWPVSRPVIILGARH